MITPLSPKKFDAVAAKKLGSTLNPEPWLHVAVLGLGNNRIYEKSKKAEDAERILYAVYVWDTRKVVEAKVIDFSNDAKGFMDTLFYFTKPKKGRNAKFSQLFHAVNAKDNCKPLQGSGNIVKQINQYIFKDK